jgi:hypothetical protein
MQAGFGIERLIEIGGEAETRTSQRRPGLPLLPSPSDRRVTGESVRLTPQPLDPALKAWLDGVIIPALVTRYLEAARLKNCLASTADRGVDSAGRNITA